MDDTRSRYRGAEYRRTDGIEFAGFGEEVLVRQGCSLECIELGERDMKLNWDRQVLANLTDFLTRELGFMLSLVLVLLLFSVACEKKPSPPAYGIPNQNDVSAKVLPGLVGDYQGSESALKVAANGTYTFARTASVSTWKQGDSKMSSALCEIKEQGNLKVIEHRDDLKQRLRLSPVKVELAKHIPVPGSEGSQQVCDEYGQALIKHSRHLRFDKMGEGVLRVTDTYSSYQDDWRIQPELREYSRTDELGYILSLRDQKLPVMQNFKNLMKTATALVTRIGSLDVSSQIQIEDRQIRVVSRLCGISMSFYYQTFVTNGQIEYRAVGEPDLSVQSLDKAISESYLYQDARCAGLYKALTTDRALQVKGLSMKIDFRRRELAFQVADFSLGIFSVGYRGSTFEESLKN